MIKHLDRPDERVLCKQQGHPESRSFFDWKFSRCGFCRSKNHPIS